MARKRVTVFPCIKGRTGGTARVPEGRGAMAPALPELPMAAELHPGCRARTLSGAGETAPSSNLSCKSD